MFRIVKRLIHWTGKYRKRILLLGFVYCFFFTAFFTAIPIMLAAKGLSAVFRRFSWSGRFTGAGYMVSAWCYGIGRVRQIYILLPAC